VVWVALLALGLLGVAATTLYLRRKAEADAAVHVASAEAAALAALAASKPTPVAAPPPRPEPKPEPGPEPAKEPPSDPVPEASPAPPPSTAAAEPAPAPPAGPPQAAPPPPRRDDAASALRGVLARAREQRDRGRCEAALDLYGQALALDGRNAAALSGRGACYLDLSRYVQAEASFVGALDSDPRNAEALYGMAETYRYMGRKGEAVVFYEKFLAVRPTGDDAAAARRLISQLKE
jgi:tetratricopeptide (TPR) repeat protein